LDADFGPLSPRMTAMIWATEPERTQSLSLLAHISGYTARPWNPGQSSDYVLVDLCSETEMLRDFLAELVGYLEQYRSVAMVWTSLTDLEVAFAILPPAQCHFLIDADDVEAVPILAGALGRRGMNRLHDKDRQVEFGSLHRISDELAEFARTLARIAESDTSSGMADKPVSFRPAPLGGFQPFPTKAPATPASLTPETLREIIRLRRQRERYFDNGLFADPAWDILLDLKAAQLEKQMVSVSSLCIAAAVPPTTALRWISAMTESGMLIRQQDPVDARRVFILLSDETNARIEDYFASIADRLVQII
jgi:DNA-binding MarR family transcriptional regulator